MTSYDGSFPLTADSRIATHGWTGAAMDGRLDAGARGEWSGAGGRGSAPPANGPRSWSRRRQTLCRPPRSLVAKMAFCSRVLLLQGALLLWASVAMVYTAAPEDDAQVVEKEIFSSKVLRIPVENTRMDNVIHEISEEIVFTQLFNFTSTDRNEHRINNEETHAVRFRPELYPISPVGHGVHRIYKVVPTAVELPTLYEHYGEGVRQRGLETTEGVFTLNGRLFSLFSGAIHYFRVPPQLWRDRLRRMRAAGVLAVETYMPWNLHNPAPGVYDFGDGQTAWSPYLDIVQFLRIAQEEDLVALVRPGPYICAEWEFGGLPSWLLRDQHMQVRTSYEPYKQAVQAYFERLAPLLAPMHWLQGGPIIALQIENEYGALGVLDKPYLEFLKELLENGGLPGLFYTSDSPLATGDRGALPGVLQTANFQSNPEGELNALSRLQPGQPHMVMEFWSGWFDHWTEHHHTTPLASFTDVLRRILEFPSGVNFYMFHGGTNWGFMNGANTQTNFPTYQPDIASYDYDAPLTEAGDYTPKWTAVKTLLAAHAAVALRCPDAPAERPKGQPAPARLLGSLSLRALAAAVPSTHHIRSDYPLPMELLELGNGAGQSYGFLLYRLANEGALVRDGTVLTVRGRVRDVAVLLVNGVRASPPLRTVDDFKGFGYWEKTDASVVLSSAGEEPAQLEVLVENWGRVNYGTPTAFHQRKGLLGHVELDGVTISPWEHLPLQFEPAWLNELSGWEPIELESAGGETGFLSAPTLFRVEVNLEEPTDTWIDMRGWGKGVVFVNGFALGRYLHLGPSQTLFWPAPLQQSGVNEVLVFELFNIPTNLTLQFSNQPILGPVTRQRRPI